MIRSTALSESSSILEPIWHLLQQEANMNNYGHCLKESTVERVNAGSVDRVRRAHFSNYSDKSAKNKLEIHLEIELRTTRTINLGEWVLGGLRFRSTGSEYKNRPGPLLPANLTFSHHAVRHIPEMPSIRQIRRGVCVFHV